MYFLVIRGAMQIWLFLMGRGSIGQMRHLSGFYALIGESSRHPPRAVNDRMALTCSCPTPFPHFNALLNHRWGCWCYNPVTSLCSGDICVLGEKTNQKKKKKTGVVAFLAPPDELEQAYCFRLFVFLKERWWHLIHHRGESPESKPFVLIPIVHKPDESLHSCLIRFKWVLLCALDWW